MADSLASFDKYRIAFDGANNATSATDALGHTLTFNGAAKLSTATWKFGTASLYLDGTANTTVTSPNSSDLDLGTGDFCVDMWVRFQAGSTVFSISNGTTAGLRLQQAVGRYLVAYNGTTVIDWTMSGYATDILRHVAITRTSGTLRLYVDASLVGEVSASAAMTYTAGTTLTIGGDNGNTSLMTGYIDEFRLTKGAARWSGPGLIPPVNNFDSSESAVTTTTLGTRTRQVSAYGAYYHDSLISQVNDAVVALGWTLWDVVYRNTVTCVYRCLNADGSSYKYTAFIWDRHRMRVTQITMESWDQTTHTSTNEAFSNLRSFGVHGYALQNCDVIVYGSNRYLGLMTYMQGSPSLWSLCVEVEREAPEDTAGGVPCWGMMYADTALTTGHSSSAYSFVFLPRAKDGTTGQGATQNQVMVTNFGAFGVLGYSTSSGKLADLINSASTTWRTFSYGWDTAKKLISHFRFVKHLGTTDTSLTVYGRAFAAKICPPIGAAVMDRVSVPIDSNLWFASGGTATDHWVLPPITSNRFWLSGTGSVIPDAQSWATGQVINAMVYTGQFIYIATNANGVYKVDTTSGATSAVSGTSGQIMDLAFDGRYVYAATSTGVTQIDTANADALVNVTVGTGGIHSLAISLRGQLVCSQRTAATTVSSFRIDIPSMGNVSSAISMPATTTASVVHSMCFDDTGLVCGYSTGNGTTIADNRIGRLDPSNLSAATSFTHSALYNASGVTWQQQFFSAAFFLAGASPTVNSFTLNANTSASQQAHYVAAVSPVNTVAGPTLRGFIEKPSGGTFLTCMANASAVQHLMTFDGAAPYGGQANGLNTSVAGNSSSTATGMRAFLATCNQVFAAGHDNTIYVAKNLFYKGYNTTTSYSNMLLPK